MVLKAVNSFYPKPPEDVDDCIKKTEDIFSPILTAMYVKSKGIEKSNENLEEAKQLFKIVKDSVKVNMNNSLWMNQAHINRAENKLDQISAQIGYPNSILNDAWLDSSKYLIVYPYLLFPKTFHFNTVMIKESVVCICFCL